MSKHYHTSDCMIVFDPDGKYSMCKYTGFVRERRKRDSMNIEELPAMYRSMAISNYGDAKKGKKTIKLTEQEWQQAEEELYDYPVEWWVRGLNKTLGCMVVVVLVATLLLIIITAIFNNG